MEKIVFDSKSVNIPFQMHDEIIGRIILTESSIQLCFDDIHFNSEHSKAILSFSGMEEVSCSACLEVYEVKRTKISKGEIYFTEDFESFFLDNGFSLIVVDMWVGYESFMITGKVCEGDYIGDKHFLLKIESSTLEYIWI